MQTTNAINFVKHLVTDTNGKPFLKNDEAEAILEGFAKVMGLSTDEMCRAANNYYAKHEQEIVQEELDHMHL